MTKFLKDNDVKEAWNTVKGWYRTVCIKAHPPCKEFIHSKTKERVDLYAKQSLPGDYIPVHVHFNI